MFSPRNSLGIGSESLSSSGGKSSVHYLTYVLNARYTFSALTFPRRHLRRFSIVGGDEWNKVTPSIQGNYLFHGAKDMGMYQRKGWPQ